MKAFMYMVGYDRQFMESCRTGWGCGYIAIPVESDLIKSHFERVKKEQQADTDDNFVWVDEYFRGINFDEEITYTQQREINGINYLVIGFDTAHSYNNKSHDFNYVFNKTNKMLNQVNELL